MILYRISDCNYINDLNGTGTRLFGARWCNKGKPGLYPASTRALSVLEVLVHLQPLFVPDNFCLAEIEVPDDSITQISLSSLPENWKDISPIAEIKKIGDDFLAENKYLMLQLPSAIVPAEFNYLVNPLHPDMKKVKVIKHESFSFDERLIYAL
jgi:RES domain-containing protein